MQTQATHRGAYKPQPIGVRATSGKATWVQTGKEAHEAWARLTMTCPTAASLLHTLVARMAERNALVISRKTLADLVGCCEATIKRAIKVLRDGNWIQVIQVGGKGGVNAYVVNSAVAWSQHRNLLHLASFTAQVVVSAAEQEDKTKLVHKELQRLPVFVARSDVQ